MKHGTAECMVFAWGNDSITQVILHNETLEKRDSIYKAQIYYKIMDRCDNLINKAQQVASYYFSRKASSKQVNQLGNSNSTRAEY